MVGGLPARDEDRCPKKLCRGRWTARSSLSGWWARPVPRVSLTGACGLLGSLTKRVLETALEGEMDEQLGYVEGDPASAGSGNSRNGKRAKTVITEVGPVDIEVPGTGTGASIRRSCASASAAWRGSTSWCFAHREGLTTGEVSAHLAEVYGAQVSKDTVSAGSGLGRGERRGPPERGRRGPDRRGACGPARAAGRPRDGRRVDQPRTVDCSGISRPGAGPVAVGVGNRRPAGAPVGSFGRLGNRVAATSAAAARPAGIR